MLSVAAPLLLALLADVPDRPVADAGVGARPSEVSLSVASGTAAVLPGLAVGVTAEGRRRLSPRLPFFAAARLQWSDASGANESWFIDHQQFVAAAAAGVSATAGAGRVWAEAGVGAAALHETLSRHEAQRIQAAGVPGGTETAFSVGPYAFAEAGVALVLRGGVRALVAAGPTVTRSSLDGGALWRLGGLGRVGVSYEF
jgi:hypothetical protein